MRTLVLIVAVSTVLSAAQPAGADDPVTLRFAQTGSPTSPTWTLIWKPWIDRIEAASEGTLKIQPFHGPTLATMQNVYDRIEAGVADLGSGVQGSIGGRFPGSSVVELPSDAISKEASSSLWRLHEGGPIAAEYAETRPLALYVFPQSFLNLRSPVEKIAEVRGLKIATLTKSEAELFNLLGAAPVSTSPIELYQALQRRTIDGVAIGWLGLVGFKLQEVVKHHILVRTGSGGGFVSMNKAVYAKLPAKAKSAVDANSGHATSMLFGETLDRIYANSERIVRGEDGHSFADADPDGARQFRAIADQLIDAWTKKTPNGPAILAAYRAEVARVRGRR
jgi:TRAP-type C4-dicarboxylate transport system substrate-binding protein